MQKKGLNLFFFYYGKKKMTRGKIKERMENGILVKIYNRYIIQHSKSYYIGIPIETIKRWKKKRGDKLIVKDLYDKVEILPNGGKI